jgi:chemotaxis protein CheD
MLSKPETAIAKPVLRSSDAHSRLPEVYLHPGQSHIAGSPTVLKMILGSCAGVFLLDPVLGLAGATHYMLPRHPAGQPSPRYGDVALRGLLGKFLELGSSRRNIQAKLFGGASVMAALRGSHTNHIGQIGVRNIEIAIEMLGEVSVAIVEKNVFGNRGRKVSMTSDTGEITLEFVSSADGYR